MMLIICDKSPDKAVDWLVENTNKNFCFKQLLELGQLISSVLKEVAKENEYPYFTAGIDALLFKGVKQGQKLKLWIANNAEYVCLYMDFLMSWCFANINLMDKTKYRFRIIYKLFYTYIQEKLLKSTKLTTAIWRYSKEYKSDYPTNSELDIDLCCKLYKKYLLEFKGFGKNEV